MTTATSSVPTMAMDVGRLWTNALSFPNRSKRNVCFTLITHRHTYAFHFSPFFQIHVFLYLFILLLLRIRLLRRRCLPLLPLFLIFFSFRRRVSHEPRIPSKWNEIVCAIMLWSCCCCRWIYVINQCRRHTHIAVSQSVFRLALFELLSLSLSLSSHLCSSRICMNSNLLLFSTFRDTHDAVDWLSSLLLLTFPSLSRCFRVRLLFFCKRTGDVFARAHSACNIEPEPVIIIITIMVKMRRCRSRFFSSQSLLPFDFHPFFFRWMSEYEN